MVDADMTLLKQKISRLNMEMAATEEMLGIACSLKPHSSCLVPEKRQELTTEGGLDVRFNMEMLTEVVDKLQDGGIRVSFFIDPDSDQVKAVDKIGADYIEIHTGAFAEAKGWKREEEELGKIGNAVKLAAKLGLGVNAGHGLNYTNIRKIATLGGIEEYNIGHSIISRAVLVGLDRAVRDMVDLIKYA
jgi:pyridoxine 5-phosphate synthase